MGSSVSDLCFLTQECPKLQPAQFDAKAQPRWFWSSAKKAHDFEWIFPPIQKINELFCPRNQRAHDFNLFLVSMNLIWLLCLNGCSKLLYIWLKWIKSMYFQKNSPCAYTKPNLTHLPHLSMSIFMLLNWWCCRVITNSRPLGRQ